MVPKPGWAVTSASAPLMDGQPGQLRAAFSLLPPASEISCRTAASFFVTMPAYVAFACNKWSSLSLCQPRICQPPSGPS